jgi:hypothetical protein
MASVLKPVDGSCLYEKIAHTLASTGGMRCIIIGVGSQASQDTMEQVSTVHPHLACPVAPEAIPPTYEARAPHPPGAENAAPPLFSCPAPSRDHFIPCPRTFSTKSIEIFF